MIERVRDQSALIQVVHTGFGAGMGLSYASGSRFASQTVHEDSRLS